MPPPPPGVDTNLNDKPGAAPASIRERLAEHRKNPSCNSCHSVIDPLGFTLENFDVIGGWRTVDESGRKVDAAGTAMKESVPFAAISMDGNPARPQLGDRPVAIVKWVDGTVLDTVWQVG